MGLDAGRGAVFPRSSTTTTYKEGKPSANEAAGPISQAAGERS